MTFGRADLAPIEKDEPHNMTERFWIVVSWPALIALLTMGLATGCGSVQEAAAVKEDSLPVLGAVPDFSLTERSGGAVSLADLQGEVWVADFVFTNCAGPCPMLSSQMAKLQKALAGAPDVRLVSFSVDPEKDTPAVLSEYAQRFGADPDRWLFLTGEKSVLYRLIRHGFKLGIDDGTAAEGGEPGPGIITHSVRFVLVDRQGRIRGYFDGTENDLVETLLPRIQQVAAETS